MTTDQARKLVKEFQERTAQYDDRHGETQRLSRAVSAILDLASQLDALQAPAPDPVVVAEPDDAGLDNTPPAKRRKADGE